MTHRVGLKREPKWNKYFDFENSKSLARDNHSPTMSCYYFGSGKCLFMRLLKSPDCLHEYWVVTFPDTFRRKHVVCQSTSLFARKVALLTLTFLFNRMDEHVCLQTSLVVHEKSQLLRVLAGVNEEFQCRQLKGLSPLWASGCFSFNFLYE